MRRVEMFGLNFCAAESLQAVLADVWNTDVGDISGLPLMITPNVDQIVKLSKPEHADLARALSEAHWILPDGQPLVAVSKLKGGPYRMPTRLPGSDFFPMIWKQIRRADRAAAFVLPSEALGEAFEGEHNRVFWYAPPYFSADDQAETEKTVLAAVEICRRRKPEFLFLGLGFPKQEIIALGVLGRLKAEGLPLPKTFLLGASFEFYFGMKKRAPKIWQKLGLEFFHRFLSEPKRMFRRYFVDDLAFLPIAGRELFSKRR